MTDEPWVALIGQILARRDDKSYAATRARLRRGLRPHGQDVAEKVVARYADGNLAALTRAASLPAVHDAPHRSGARFGSVMAELTRLRTGAAPPVDLSQRDNVGRRVTLLPRLPLEAAVKEISVLLAFASAEGLSVDYYDLTRTILGWGDGFDDTSKSVRAAIMIDYYTA